MIEQAGPLTESATGEAAIIGLGERRRVVALIPAYNEERCIGSVILRARVHVDEVIVVDDGSRDATALVAQAAGAQLIRHEVNIGTR